ncbi:uncharacterized protein LOC128181172 [Crassostrea angulata]|uniref:uncharacterized protein LOC128181172 n=1 Tax=Magallana angulata TaxID=2784310 RepID=UPI0022B1997F|nr:uncharacterized protein LOC128181172 [Crassostrea angulata]
MTMDPEDSAQEVVCCILCQDSVPLMYCEVCDIHLCKDCVEKHLLDVYKFHNVIPLKQYWGELNYPKCRRHHTKECDHYCQQCDIPICTRCISRKHLGHNKVDILFFFKSKTKTLQSDLCELEKSIYPKYQETASSIPVQKADLNELSKKLTSLNKREDVWNKEIQTIIKNLNKMENVIAHTVSEIRHSIAALKKILVSEDIRLISEYKSRNAEFRKMPPNLRVSLTNFGPREINIDQLIEEFDSLSALYFKTKEQDYSMLTKGAESFPPDRSLMDVPQVITVINTGYKYLHGVICLNDENVWTNGDDSIKLFNLQSELVQSIHTKTGKEPRDIAVTKSGDLVYTDYHERTVNVVKNTQVETLISVGHWKPHGVCITSSDGLLVVMDNDDDKQTRVVRYSGSKKKQRIQYNDKGRPLYSSGGIKYITENKNLDICVSDWKADAVVVVNQAGEHRFTYTGSPTTTVVFFRPYDITTDSQSRILVADCYLHNNRIHILDIDGQFLRYIDNCQLLGPWGVCVDTRDNLFVAENDTDRVKKIQYYV